MMKRSPLTPFLPGNGRNTILRLAANALGIPLVDEPEHGRQDNGKQPWMKSMAFDPETRLNMRPAAQRNNTENSGNNHGIEDYSAVSASSGVYPYLQKSFLDENTKKTRFGRQLRSPHVLYDSATNMIDTLEGDENPSYYDEETEQYIIDATQKRANPRYEFLLPEMAEERQKQWEKANSRFAKNWNPAYGVLDGRQRRELGYNQINAYTETGAARQKLEDQTIRQAAELDYKKPDTLAGNIIHEMSDQAFNREKKLLANSLQAKGDLGDEFLRERMELEKEPLNFYRNAKKIKEIMNTYNVGLADAIEMAKREAISAYMDDLAKSQDENFAYDYFYKNMTDGRTKDFYGIVKNALVDTPARMRAKQKIKDYFSD